jgi:hypothetical protein
MEPRSLATLALAGALLAAFPARAAVDDDPPKIDHAPVEEAPAGAALALSAAITDDSEIFEPTLYYRVAGTRKFLSASMHRIGVTRYSAAIPEAVMTADVEYFIEAYDSNGNGPSQFASADKPQRVKVGPAGREPAPKVPPVARAEGRRHRSQAPAEATARAEGGGLLRAVGFSAAGLGVAGLGLGT